MNPFLLEEAIQSTALSHPEGLEHRAGCDTCKAAHGDKEARTRIWLAMLEAEERR